MNRAMSSFAIFAGIAGAYLLSIGRAHLGEVAAQRAATLAAYERFERREAEAAREVELLECLERLERWRDEHRAALTAVGETTSLLLATTTRLENDGLAVERSEAMPPDSLLDRPHCRMHFTVSGTLAGLFHGVCNLENSAMPTRITDLTVHAAAAAGVRGELTIVCTWSEGS